MTYLFALIGIIAIAFLIWRSFGPTPTGEGSDGPSVLAGRKPRPRSVAPDDDPEFLRDLALRTKRPETPDNEDR